ncbi:MAG TPA: hypothetical protein VFA17_01735 [Thermoplasmata archaeon]|nr:hypothetical protein [Thermoplasmata archaeon]
MFSLSRVRSRAIAIASSAAFALVLASTFAVAQGVDSDQDGVPDNLEDATQRTVAVSSAGDEFNVSSHLGTGSIQDQFEFWYWAGHFGVWYGVWDGASITYNVELRNLIEWRDQDGNGRMDPSEILGAIPLSTSAFGGVAVVRAEKRDPDGGHVYNFVVNGKDGRVSLNVTVAQRFTRLDGVTLTPMEARMDVLVRPNLSDPSRSVALELRFQTGRHDVVTFENRSWDEQNRFAPGEHAINVTETDQGRSASAFLSWANDASDSGQSVAVDSIPSARAPEDYNLTLAYPRGSTQTGSIVHQMAFGIRSVAFESIESATPPPPPLQPDLYLFTATFATVAALVAATVLLSNRRRVRSEQEGRKP